ncbi:MAG: prolyl oligopeptidase family serine peptidase, partial [Halioglobus sp.]|nr:prolyl oligopeptidase family serine peptidase [Halioglobus sp.]
IGPSAGGHLAALAGTANRPGELDVGEPSDVPSHVHAVVDYFGPTDFLQGDAHRTEDADPWNAPGSAVSRLIGMPIESAPDKVARANPITFIDGSEPPFLIIHGEKDGLVPLHQSQILHAALQAAEVSSELLVVKGGDHGYGGDFSQDEHSESVRAFFRTHLRPDET